MRTRLVTTICICTVLAAACSSGSDDSASKNALPAQFRNVVDLRGKAKGSYPEVDVAVKDNDFAPSAIRINPGTTVRWENSGRSPHDIVPADPNQDFGHEFGVSADKFEPGAAYEFKFVAPGVYRYYCALHGSKNVGMIGEVVVGDVDATSGERAVSGGQQRNGTLRVPHDYSTIQAAVDAAKPGSLVLVSPGVYKEAVTVTSPNIVIRGLDRTGTVLDGGFVRDNGIKVLANGVAVENMTARDYTNNGFFWTGVLGYRGSYLDAIRNGDYGIYAFNSTYGQFDHDYGAGSPDAGFYIGQCYPCHAVISDSISEWNGIGYSGTNAGGDLFVVRSIWRNNRVGIVPNSGTEELNFPQHGITIAGNAVYGNNNAKTAAISIAQLAIGTGILVAGGNDDVVQHNLVYDHDIVGIGVIPLPERVINPDDAKAINFDARRNRVVANVVRDSRAADLALVTNLDNAKDSGANCFAGNRFSTSLPAHLEQLVPCAGTPSPAYETDLNRFVALLGADKPGGADYKKVVLPEPPRRPGMPDASRAPARPAGTGVPMAIDVNSIATPAG
ncbi:MAG TPA: plastocyanin/azurin family copper-binding protein [Acidimicrobiia bacterium]|nr:plastocyanin/azurin family copper-binding protein [Acidimicrobiia bacterium]